MFIEIFWDNYEDGIKIMFILLIVKMFKIIWLKMIGYMELIFIEID